MLPDMDTHQKAERLIAHYGDAAPLLASKRADESRVEGDTEAEEAWLMVLGVVERRLAQRPARTKRRIH